MSGPREVEREPDRAELVAAAVEKNRRIWVRMALRITSNPQDAEDAVQEAITRVLQGAGNLPDVDSVGRYLTRSVNHCAIDRVRARSRLTGFAEDPEEPGPRLEGVDPTQEARLVAEEEERAKQQRLERTMSALAEIPEEQRQAVELLILRDPPLKLRQASEITGAPISTLHSRLKAGLKKLRGKLSENDGEHR